MKAILNEPNTHHEDIGINKYSREPYNRKLKQNQSHTCAKTKNSKMTNQNNATTGTASNGDNNTCGRKSKDGKSKPIQQLTQKKYSKGKKGDNANKNWQPYSKDRFMQ